MQDGLCVDRNALALTSPPCDPGNNKPPASTALQDPALYGHLLDSFSMRQFIPGEESGHDHFFATFGKFGAATNGHTADMLAEVRSRAAAGHLQYMELMFNPDGGAAGRLGASLGWNDDLSRMREQLLSGGLPKIIADASKFLDDTEKQEQGICAAVSRRPVRAAAFRPVIFIRYRAALRKKWSLPRFLPDLRWRQKIRAWLVLIL